MHLLATWIVWRTWCPASKSDPSHRQLETAQTALQNKELTIAKMRGLGREGLHPHGNLAQDMAFLGYTLGIKGAM